jgi:hypothetical protein
VVTTTSITAVSVSMRSAQSTWKSPDVIQGAAAMTSCEADSTAAPRPSAVVISSAIQPRRLARGVQQARGHQPARRGRRCAAEQAGDARMEAAPSADQRQKDDDCTLFIHAGSALHQIDVFNRDRAAVAEIDDQDGQPDRRLGRGDGQHEQREHLADEIVAAGRSRTPRG